jgi:hypothetical protein
MDKQLVNFITCGCESSAPFFAVYCIFMTCRKDMGYMVFNATFNNISVILWQSVLLVEETGKKHTDKLYHILVLFEFLIMMALNSNQSINLIRYD